MKLICCERCQIYWTCERKWYRGERQEENICCEQCDYYRECVSLMKRRHNRLVKAASRKKSAI